MINNETNNGSTIEDIQFELNKSETKVRSATCNQIKKKIYFFISNKYNNLLLFTVTVLNELRHD